MSVVAQTKELSRELGKGVEVIGKKVSDVLDQVASHLPFSNFAKKEDSSFHLEVDLPGVTKEDIEITVEDEMLRIRAIRHYKHELSQESYYICESSFGKLERYYRLPDNVDSENISAAYEDGRLVLTLQKLPKAQPKHISIK